MPSRKPSKHSKKAWRKTKRAAEDVEEALEEATHNELHGTNFELIPCADLFYEDKAGTTATTPDASQPPQTRQAKPRKVLKSEAILEAGRVTKPLISQPRKAGKGAPKAVEWLAPLRRQQQQRQDAASLDLWGNDAQPSKGAWAKRPRRSAAGAEPAVEVDQPGCSYNPDAAQHQDAVAVAVAAEVSKGLAAQLAPQAPPLLAGDAGAAEQDELGLLQVDEEADAGQPSYDEAAAAAAGVDRRMPAPKTQTQRNREQRRKQADAELKARQANKAAARDINQLKQLAAELEVEEQARAAKLLRKQVAKAEKRAEAPPRLGKTPFTPEPVQVLLTEELNGSLRQLRPSATLARERFKSLQKRGILEPRTRVRKHVGKRIASGTYASRQADRTDGLI